MRLSFYTYSYTDRLELPIVPCLERIARTGYSGIDVSGTHGKSDDPRSFDAARRKLTRETAERLDLRIEAIVTHAQLTDSLLDTGRPPLDLKGSVDLAQELGGTVVTFHMGGYHAGTPRERLWRHVVEVVREAADYGAARHIQLAVDGIWPVWIDDTADALDRLFDEVGSPNFGVNFDPCYLTLMGVDPVDFANRFRTRIEHAHLKDHTGSYPQWQHRLPGQGEMDYTKIFRGLSDNNFAGSAAVECFTDMKFEQACDNCFAAMTAAARGAGVVFDS